MPLIQGLVGILLWVGLPAFSFAQESLLDFECDALLDENSAPNLRARVVAAYRRILDGPGKEVPLRTLRAMLSSNNLWQLPSDGDATRVRRVNEGLGLLKKRLLDAGETAEDIQEQISETLASFIRARSIDQWTRDRARRATNAAAHPLQFKARLGKPSGRLAPTMVQNWRCIRWPRFKLSPDGRFLMAQDSNNPPVLWNLPQGTQTQTLSSKLRGFQYAGFSEDAKHLLVGFNDARIAVLDLASLNINGFIQEHQEPVTHAHSHINLIRQALLPRDRSTLFTYLGWPGSFRNNSWNFTPNNGQLYLNRDAKFPQVVGQFIGLHPHHKILVAALERGEQFPRYFTGPLSVWRYDTHEMDMLQIPVAQPRDHQILQFTQDYRLLLVRDGREYQLWEIDWAIPQAKLLHRVDSRATNEILYYDFASIAAQMAFLKEGNQDVVLLDLKSGVSRRVVHLPHPVTAIAISPDGRSLACGFSDGSIALIDTASGEILDQPGRGVESVEYLEFTQDGLQLISQSRSINLWDIRR
jgi:WD40 repeat protein